MSTENGRQRALEWRRDRQAYILEIDISTKLLLQLRWRDEGGGVRLLEEANLLLGPRVDERADELVERPEEAGDVDADGAA